MAENESHLPVSVTVVPPDAEMSSRRTVRVLDPYGRAGVAKHSGVNGQVSGDYNKAIA